MNDAACLILENGAVFEGKFFGAGSDTTGEIVFTTGMIGYQETLTDQTYYGQIVLQTFPLIGNYGIISEDIGNASISAKGYIVKQPCATPSNFRSGNNLDNFLKERGVTGLYGIDTRALTKIIRENGVMNGKISARLPAKDEMAAAIAEIKAYSIKFPIGAVSRSEVTKTGGGDRKIAILDFGAKREIAETLASRGCEVWTFPYNTPAEEILKIKPRGVVLSNGPGDPADPWNNGIIETIRALDKNGATIFGICVGHQLLARAKGYSTRKLKLGHRGENQPVRDTRTGRVYVTSQNHGYEVIASDSSYINVNDNGCEGLDYGNSFSVQFRPDTSGGTSFLFDRFLERADAAK